MDLRLFGTASADHGFLDEPWSIFADFDPRACSAHQGNTASLAELERRLRVLVDKHFLDGGGRRRVVDDQRVELIGERGQPARQRYRTIGLDLAVGDVGEAVAFSLDQPPAGGSKARVEAEDLQASRSSSSSGTS